MVCNCNMLCALYRPLLHVRATLVPNGNAIPDTYRKSGRIHLSSHRLIDTNPGPVMSQHRIFARALAPLSSVAGLYFGNSETP